MEQRTDFSEKLAATVLFDSSHVVILASLRERERLCLFLHELYIERTSARVI